MKISVAPSSRFRADWPWTGGGSLPTASAQVVIVLVKRTLQDLKLAIAGTIVMSAELQEALDNLVDARVPPRWGQEGPPPRHCPGCWPEGFWKIKEKTFASVGA